MKKNSILLLFLLIILPGMSFSQGCMEPASEEGVSVIGYLQPQYEFHQTPNGNTNSFTFNRARIGVTGNVPYDFGYYAMIDFSRFKPDATYILDAFITYKRFSFAKITLGQFKSPLSQEFNTACHKLYTINRSKVVNELVNPDRDQGAMIWGLFASGKISYNLAVMNGFRRNFYDENPSKDIVGRVLLQPTESIRFGGSFRQGVSGAKSDNIKTRLAGELQINWRGFLLQAEYIYGKDTGSYTTGGGCDGTPIEIHDGPVERNGMYAMLMYMTPWNLQPVIKYENYNSNLELDNNMENMVTYGVNYFFNDWTRLQLNYVYRAEQSDEIPNDCFQLQLQVEF